MHISPLVLVFDAKCYMIDADSIRGQKLMCRTEFNAQVDHHLSLTLARRKDGEDDADASSAIVSAQSILLYGMYG